MQDLFEQILGYVRGVWRARWVLLIASWVLLLAGIVVVATMPDRYEATARVHVDSKSVLTPLLRGLTVPQDIQSRVDILTRTLLSRPNLEKLVRMTDLDLSVKTNEEMEVLLRRLEKEIRVKGQSRKELYIISYDHEDSATAKRVVGSLLTIFIESVLGDTRQDSSRAQEFLDEQIKEYEVLLLSAEERLKEFKQKNVGLMPGENGGYYQRLQAAVVALEKERLAQRELTEKRDELKRQLEGENNGIVVKNNETVNPTAELDTRIAKLQSSLDQLLLSYTDNHPDVISLKQTIDKLQQQRNEQLKALNYDENKAALVTNPVYQQLKVALGSTEAELAAVTVRVNEFQSRVNQLRSAVDEIPQVEAELKRLNRDYEVNKKKYESLLDRRESAKISQDVEQMTESVQIKIIDPPFVPITPAWPNRVLFFSAVFVLALGGGVGLAFVYSQLRPVIYSPRELYTKTGLPVIGRVSAEFPARKKVLRLAERTVWVAGFFGMVGVYLLVIYIEKFGHGVALVLKQVVA